MSSNRPWYADHLNIQNFCTVSGIVLMLCAAGGIEFLGFKFNPSKDVPLTARLILLSSGVVLTFVGLTLQLQKAKLWKNRYSYLFLIVNISLISSIGYFSIDNEAETKLYFFRKWGVSVSNFNSEIETARLKKYDDKYEIMLICRKVDIAIPYMDDINIQKSFAYTIFTDQPVQRVGIEFNQTFSDNLKIGDEVNCSLCAVPKNYSINKLKNLASVEQFGGVILDAVSAKIKSDKKNKSASE